MPGDSPANQKNGFGDSRKIDKDKQYILTADHLLTLHILLANPWRNNI
jgi:hypothetical protein